MRTKKEAEEFVERIYLSWVRVYHNYYVKTPVCRLKEFDQFTEKFYSDFDSFKNMTDENGLFLFEQLSTASQQRFNEIIIQYSERQRDVAPYRRELDNIKLQKQIDEMNRQGLFAPGKQPTIAEVTQDWLKSYGSNVVVVSSANPSFSSVANG